MDDDPAGGAIAVPHRVGEAAIVEGPVDSSDARDAGIREWSAKRRDVGSRSPVIMGFAFIALILAAACGNDGNVAGVEESRSASTSPSSPQVEQVVEDLRAYIPGRLESEGVPGLGIALIHDGEIAWEGAFGDANALTGDPVTTASVFEVQSNSKPVAAYTALKLVESGVLQLDEPIGGQLDQPWLSPSRWSEEITLRQLLSHTSGLSSRLHPLDKSISFEP
ncbi:MAG: beta-lactamase family protein, partial [Acidimicrobiia bacterium]|nr:beta-lactamase family protein [Acidimicrobiia bacterium]